MFAQSFVATTLLALVAVTAATSSYPGCSTGPIQCCDSTSSTVTPSIAQLLGSLNIDVSSVAVPIGLTCSPIQLIGVGSGSSCTGQTVCCENDNFNGLVALGCTPINVNL
ncbi:hydrophobin [Boletus reticuloceps]|uniref:Hydrophobin n=1 Tax=Boletus reticuloceps TaxID=495285 RepID=A0A8I3AE19_9AGAM|nr:hydrophobin [Boletus reticuloceps]